MLNEHYVAVVLKWSKTLQNSSQGSYIILPKLKDTRICPLEKFNAMQKCYPMGRNASCFATNEHFITERTLRKHLRTVLLRLGLDPLRFTFPSFRRSGATLAYNLDIDIDEIKRHGTWRSDAVNTYIIADPQKASGVAHSFKRFFDGP